MALLYSVKMLSHVNHMQDIFPWLFGPLHVYHFQHGVLLHHRRISLKLDPLKQPGLIALLWLHLHRLLPASRFDKKVKIVQDGNGQQTEDYQGRVGLNEIVRQVLVKKINDLYGQSY